jgi:1-acyl-sn-glycerol-3-phosphate acyltransferase
MTPNPSVPQLIRHRLRWRRMVRFVVQRVVLRILLHTLTRTTLEGRDHLNNVRGPFILVANHCSHLDTVVIVATIPYHVVRHLAVGAAADHFYTKRSNRLATSFAFNAFPIHRKSGGGKPEKGMSQRLLEMGVPLLIYPEGTRSRNGELGAFRPGAAALCVSAVVTCIPVALQGTAQAMPVGRCWPVRGRPAVHMTIGEPLVPAPGEDVPSFNDRIVGSISAMQARPAVRARLAMMTAPVTAAAS